MSSKLVEGLQHMGVKGLEHGIHILEQCPHQRLLIVWIVRSVGQFFAEGYRRPQLLEKACALLPILPATCSSSLLLVVQILFSLPQHSLNSFWRLDTVVHSGIMAGAVDVVPGFCECSHLFRC